MTALTFTPQKFAALLLASLIVALGTNNLPTATRAAANAGPLAPYPATQAVGQDNGALTENYFVAAAFTPTPVNRTPDRRAIVNEPTPAPTQAPPIRRSYPPLAR